MGYSPYIAFDYLNYEHSGLVSTAVREVVASGNTTRSWQSLYTDAPVIEFPMKNEYGNCYVAFVDGVAINNGFAQYAPVSDDNLTYRIRLKLGAPGITRKIQMGLRGQALGATIGSAYTMTAAPQSGDPVLCIGDSWSYGTGAALDTVDPFGGTQPGILWNSCAAVAGRLLDKNLFIAAKGGTGWSNSNGGATYDGNFLERLTARLAGDGRTYSEFWFIGSGNDKDENFTTVKNNMLAGYALCRAHNPDCRIYQVGPGSYDLLPNLGSNWLNLRTAMIEAVSNYPDVNWLDTYGWLTSAADITANIHGAGTHPTKTGHAAYGALIADWIEGLEA